MVAPETETKSKRILIELHFENGGAICFKRIPIGAFLSEKLNPGIQLLVQRPGNNEHATLLSASGILFV